MASGQLGDPRPAGNFAATLGATTLPAMNHVLARRFPRTGAVCRLLGVALACVLLLSPWSPAAATTKTELGLGADYWRPGDTGAFDLTLAVRTNLSRKITVGGRFGGMVTTGARNLAAPIDLQLQANISNLYIAGSVGPWIFFDRGDWIRTHAAFGFGLQAKNLSFGLELGYLSPGAIMGLRFATAL